MLNGGKRLPPLMMVQKVETITNKIGVFMGKVALTLFISFFMMSSMASEAVQLFDLKTYDPVKVGLKDFSCEVRLAGITDKIKQNFPTLNIKDEIYYKLYWVAPGKVDFQVMGMPSGFREIKQNLKNLVVNRLDYLIPQPLGKRFRSYKMTEMKQSGGIKVIGEDPTNSLPVNKVDMFFDNEGKLSSYKSYSPVGFRESRFDYGKKSWSKNKWVLKEVEAKMIQGPQVTEIETEIDYKNYVGFGFPEKISIETKQYVVSPEQNEKKNERTGKTEITFSNYKINDGAAQKYFRN